ncbi:MAG: translocation/assembly module TamB [Crocinitomicaceae bacterium]|nr:translocation/assembly module TamB [Crocinitomicaceae bacterium]
MAKLLKILGKALGGILEWVLIFVIFLSFAIRTSPVQTLLASQAASYLSKELNATINIETVAIVFPDEIALDNILLTDINQDTLLYAKTVFAKIQDYDFSKLTFDISTIDIEEGYVHLQCDQNGIFNHQFLIQYFASEKKKKKKDPRIALTNINIINTQFRYDDYREEKRTSGVDYFHINAKNINGSINDFVIKNDVYSATINEFNFNEQSGFQMQKLMTDATISHRGIFLSDLVLTSSRSKIEAEKFNMISTGLSDFKNFVDSVKFDARIDKSTIDLSDAALFAYALDGMNDTIHLTTSIEKEVKRLKLVDFNLQTKGKTQLFGTINLPDYRDPKSTFYQERIAYAYIDIDELKSIKLPNSFDYSYLELDETLNPIGHFEAQEIHLDGFHSQFVIAADLIKTNLGNIRMDNGIMFTEDKANNSYNFQKSGANEYDFKIEQFDLGTLIDNADIGIIDGIFFLSGKAKSTSEIAFTNIEGHINELEYLDYPYNNISILEGTFIDKKFDGKIDVKDDNVDLAYDGIIDFKDELHLNFEIEVQNALLDQLNISTKNSEISSHFKINLIGNDPNNFKGSIFMDHFDFKKEERAFQIPSMKIDVERGELKDQFNIVSDIAQINILGKINFDYIANDFMYQFSRIFPSLFDDDIHKYNQDRFDHFQFNATIGNSDDLLAIFYPDLHLAPETKITGHYFEDSSSFLVDLNSKYIDYRDFHFKDVEVHQIMDEDDLSLTYHASNFTFKDSLNFDDFYFKSTGTDNVLLSDLSWDQNSSQPSLIKWSTLLKDPNHYTIDLAPSYFHINKNKWHIEHASEFTINNDTLHVEDFLLTRGDQLISAEGYLSNSNNHELEFDINNLVLSEFSNFISEAPVEGTLNAQGSISNPTKNFQYNGNGNILGFKIKEQLVGDINVTSHWVKKNKSIALQGDLIYKQNQTFDFIGDYYPYRKQENLDFNLFFDHTDIQFANAFLDPDVVSEIRGLLLGRLKVSGTPDRPKLDGVINLTAGTAKIGILGTHFGIEGPIEVDDYGFYINGIPVFDEEGNAGKLIGSVYHDNFSDFNFDLNFDLEDDAINKDPLEPWRVLPLDKFLVLNSVYKPGEVYYGKGYATGMVNIFGYTDNLEITVDLETKKGTKINIPMYGLGEIDEEENFIVFANKDATVIANEPKIDFTGVDLDLNFRVTPNAEVKIIFNEELEDEITAHGKGDLEINLNSIGDITMDGIYTVTDGVYDFSMGLIKQKFYIEEGGSINWSGDPYNAILDLKTFYRVNTNIATVQNGQVNTTGSSHKDIVCYLNLKESLIKPAIDFNIQAPRANDVEKSILSQINADPAELNRQFFSLLLWKRFQPMGGNISTDGSATLDLITNQINALLSKVSNDYKLNVNLDSDILTGDNSYEFGISKGFLDDRLLFSGSFGVENQHFDDHTENAFIGDVKLEYLLNESGTFRVNIFNESNDKTIIQDQNKGPFTQGAALNYQEEFHKVKDFKVIQYFLDIFRKKKNKRYPIKRKHKQVPVPVDNSHIITPLKEEADEMEEKQA